MCQVLASALYLGIVHLSLGQPKVIRKVLSPILQMRKLSHLEPKLKSRQLDSVP